MTQAQNKNYAKYIRDGDHSFFQRTLQAVVSHPIDGDEETMKLFTNLIVMLRVLDNLQKLALLLDKPLNSERRGNLAELYRFFNKVTIGRPSLKENLLTSMKYACSVFDRFPVPFKL